MSLDLKFNFSLNNKKNKSNTSTSIIKKDVVGIVMLLSTGDFKVLCDNIKYDICRECYIVKDKDVIYSILLNRFNKRIIYYRLPPNVDKNIINYLPFGVGCSVKGNIVKENGINKFKIKQCWLNRTAEHYKEIIDYFFKNYIEIERNILDKMKKKYECSGD